MKQTLEHPQPLLAATFGLHAAFTISDETFAKSVAEVFPPSPLPPPALLPPPFTFFCYYLAYVYLAFPSLGGEVEVQVSH